MPVEDYDGVLNWAPRSSVQVLSPATVFLNKSTLGRFAFRQASSGTEMLVPHTTQVQVWRSFCSWLNASLEKHSGHRIKSHGTGDATSVIDGLQL